MALTGLFIILAVMLTLLFLGVPLTLSIHAISSNDERSTLSYPLTSIHFLNHEILSIRGMPPKFSTSRVVTGVTGI